jgi:hypothetical protein
MHNSDYETLADTLLELLAQKGVELFLANAGTDFVSLINGFAKREKKGLMIPRYWWRPMTYVPTMVLTPSPPGSS